MNLRYFFLLLSCCFLSFKVSSQTKLNIGLKVGLLRFSNEIVQTKEIGSYDSYSSEDQPNYNFAGSFSLPVNNKFRLGAELGVISYGTFLDYYFTYPDNTRERFNGRYQIDQLFLAFTPEYRFTNWWYVNGGAGLYYDYNSAFTDGTRSIGSNEVNITNLEYKRSIPFGFFAGTGICPNITKELALMGEVRYTRSPASIKSPTDVGIGYGAFNFNVGLMFKPRL